MITCLSKTSTSYCLQKDFLNSKIPYRLMAGNNSKPETSVEFAYDQLYDLVKLEEERRAYLDTKAGTYIGLLGVSVSILTAFGGILIIQNGQILKIKDMDAISSHDLLILIYFFYFIIIFLFIIAVFFAFRAYNTGSLVFSTSTIKAKLEILYITSSAIKQTFQKNYFPK